jgi:hypothetical protein
MQCLARDTAHVSGLREEVTWAREAAIATEATCAEAVHVVALIKEVEAQATLSKREVPERVSKAEEESTALLASARGEADGSLERLPFWRVSNRMCARIETLSRRTSRVCLIGCPMLTGGGRMLRGSVGTWSKSLSFYKQGDLSCAIVGTLTVRGHLSEGM